jgi:methylase of polypeptide subunit release factors
LLNNIHGVDIDPQAVEVTKLSLALKVLEGESQESIGAQLGLFKERALPDLGRNVQCGNSLIGPDYFEGKMFPDEEERYRVNAFNWQAAFPQVFIAGGFDVVIGNPPYGAAETSQDRIYYREKYEVKDIDTYALFIEQAINTSKTNSLISMIVPTGWYSGAKFSILRKLYASTTDPKKFINLPYDIFGAWVDTSIFITAKRNKKTNWPRKEASQTQLITFPKRFHIHSIDDFERDESSIDVSEWFVHGGDEYLTYSDLHAIEIMWNIEKVGKPLSDYADVQRGVTPFHLDEEPLYDSSKLGFTGTVKRYIYEKGDLAYIRYDDTLAEYKPERYFKGKRLLIRELISRQFRLQVVKVEDDFITNKSMQSILQRPDAPDLNYLLGIINSRLISWYFLSRSNIGQRDDFPKIVLKETRSLPIHTINFTDPSDKTFHDRMVSLVERMLSLHKQSPRTPQEKERLQREIESTDQAIDALVYQLYGLTDAEIKIVEGK